MRNSGDKTAETEQLDKRMLLDTLKQLKKKYEKHLSGGNTREALTRSTLIDPLLRALGWDVSDPTQCIVEDWVAKSENPDWADYSLLAPDGTTCMIWEAKRADCGFMFRDPKHPAGVWGDKSTKRFVEQGLSYAYRKGASWVVLTNGHQLALLESFRRGKEHLRPSQAKLVFNSLHEMLECAGSLWVLNRASVLNGRLDKEFGLEPQQFLVTDSLPKERTAPDIYADRPDWMNVPLADIPDREDELVLDESELIYANLLPVLELPEHMVSAPTECRHKGDVLQRVGGIGYVPCICREGRVWTFADLRLTPYFDRGVCVGRTDCVAVAHWKEDEDKRLWLTELLHDCLHEHVRERGIEAHRGHRYYFAPSGERVFRKVQYHSFSQRAERWVVAQDRTTGYWIHLAAELRFITLARAFYLLIEPTYVITEDGEKWVQGSIAGPMVTSKVSRERNLKYLYHINFWKAWLADEFDSLKDCIHLGCYDAPVLISTQFVSGKAPFSVPPFDTTECDLEDDPGG